MLSGRGDDEIGLREGVSALASFLNQEPPLEHDVFGDSERALLEHRANLVSEPVHECGAAHGIGNELDTEADLGQRHDADTEKLKRLASDEGEHLRLRPWSP